jgi:hypothetical protein
MHKHNNHYISDIILFLHNTHLQSIESSSKNKIIQFNLTNTFSVTICFAVVKNGLNSTRDIKRNENQKLVLTTFQHENARH